MSTEQVQDVYSLSPMQTGMLFQSLYAAEHSVYLDQQVFEVAGELDASAFRRAWEHLIARHAVLRTSFHWEGLEEPLQIVHPSADLPLTELDWRSKSPEEQKSSLANLLNEERVRGIDLAEPPLMRVTAIRTSPGNFKFVWTTHHLLFDRWSGTQVFNEFKAAYDELRAGRTVEQRPVRPYREYIRWLRAQSPERAESYWRGRLSGFSRPTSLPIDCAPGGLSSKGDSQRKTERLTAEASTELLALARRHHITLNTVIQGAWAALLSRYTGDSDVLFGATVSGRPASLPGVESMVGLFINSLPVRVEVDESAPVVDWLQRIQADSVEMREYEYCSLIQIQGWSDIPRGSPMFESLVVVQNTPGAEASNGAQPSDDRSRIRAAGGQSSVDFPLYLTVVPEREIRLMLNYDVERYDGDAIARLLGHLRTILESIAADPAQRVQDLPLLTEPELRQLEHWSRADAECPKSPIHRLFEEQAIQTPHAVALEQAGRELTYGELASRSDELARLICGHGVRGGDLVALLLPRSFDMVATLLGILKAGAAYVPLDPANPQQRLNVILDDVRPSLILTSSAYQDRFAGADFPIVCLDDPNKAGGAAETVSLPEMSIDDLAYVMYTSGSTGVPKGTVIPHRSVVRLVKGANYCDLGPNETILHFAPLAFDASTLEIWGGLLNGGRVVLFEGDTPALDDLGRVVRETGVTTMWLTAGLFHSVVENDLESLGGVRQLLAGGDVLFPAHVQRALKELPNTRLINGYGPTENTTFTCCYAVPPDYDGQASVPIGRPISNTQVYILDRRMRPVPIGVPGELYTTGHGLSHGYWNRPELTAERFIPNPFRVRSGGLHLEVGGEFHSPRTHVVEPELSTLNSQLSTRLYRIGDLARWLPDGNIEFLGRVDTQVKIRGFRIELGEIESVLGEHPIVRESVVLAREDTPGDKRLVAYVLGDEISVAQLREHARERLPEYMLPSAYVRMDAWPLSPNGKIDRRALPAPDRVQQEESYSAPRTPVEEGLGDIWSHVLGIEQVGIHDSFFDLGGHSLLATQVISRVRGAFQIDLPLRALFESPTISGLAPRIESQRGKAGAAHPLVRVPRETASPLSFAQQRLWFLDQLDPGSSVYNMSSALRLTGSLDIRALTESLTEIVRRHESLRTTFSQREGVACQIVHPPAPMPLPITDLSGLSEFERAEESRRLIAEEGARPFDLESGPLFRASLITLSDEEHVLLLTMHHIVSDGWSMGVLRLELASLYNSFCAGQSPPLDELPIQYPDYAVWQRKWLRGEALDRQLDYWRSRLAGAPTMLELPTDRPRPPIQTYSGAVCRLELSDELSRNLRVLAQQEGVTLFMTLLAAYQTLLYRYSRQDQVVVGSPIANRTRSEVEGMIGFFANTLALRGDLSGDPTFVEVLGRVRDCCLGAFDHQELPFEKLVDEIAPERSLSHSPIFQAAFVLQNIPGASRDGLTGLTVEPIRGEGVTARFDLLLSATQTGTGLRLALESNTDLFDADRMERLLGHYKTLLESVIDDAEQPISRLPILPAAERRQLSAWNTSIASFPADRCLHELFEAQVERTPDAVALQLGDVRLTYDQLNRLANRIAHCLRNRGVGPESLVGISADRSIEMVVGLLGILKAGGAYVPLDPAYPSDRLAFMATDAGLKLILTRMESGLDLPDVEKINTDDEAGLLAYSDENAASTTTPDNLAYVIYTSGSTGRPKGCLNTHANVVRLMSATQDWYKFGESDVWTLFHSLAFDFSVWELWGALLYGGRLIVVPFEISRSPSEFRELVEREGVTVLNQTPSAFRQFIQADIEGSGLRVQGSGDHETIENRKSKIENLRYVIFGGEKLELSTLQPWFERHGDQRPQLVNMYGITETTVHVTYRPVGAADVHGGSIIGCAIPDLQLYVFGPSMQQVPIGVPGELYVGGAGLARGYLNRPDLTAERFVPNPMVSSELKVLSSESAAAQNSELRTQNSRLYKTGDLCRYLPNGELEYLGRADDQVKVRGFRIELGEIESVLGQHPSVKEAVVLSREDTPGVSRLVAYIVGSNASLTASELREHALAKLPDYMVPAAFVMLDSLPLTPNGKLDRKALPDPDTARLDIETGYIAPRNPVEENLAEIWRSVLRLEQVGIHDNFFELGGDSILSIQIIARANAAGIHLTPRQVFQHQTIAGLAAAAGTETRASAEQGVVSGDVQLTPIQRWFFDQDLDEPHYHNQARLLRLLEPLEPAIVRAALDALIEHHDALRLRFERSETGWRQINVERESNDYFEVIDLSGQPDASRAVTTECSRIQARLNLATGPLLRAAYFIVGPHEPARILIAVHHLAIDGVSWRILLDDLRSALRRLNAGQAMTLPPKTTSYRQWAVSLVEFAGSSELSEELPFWRSIAATNSLPVDHAGEENSTASEKALRFTLDEEQTRLLLSEVPAVYHTQINDILLTALAQAFQRWTGERSLLVNLEGHGREALFVDVDISRTVGWFTSIYPALLQLPSNDDPGDSIKCVKEALRQIPCRGIGYGLLRYCHPDLQIRQSLASVPAPQVSFNYHGQIEGAGDQAELFASAAESPGQSRSPAQRRSHLLDVIGMVRNGRLQMTWLYSENLHDRATIEKLAAGYIDALGALIAHCLKPEAGGYTPSDFPRAGLNEQSLSRLIDSVGRKERIEDVYPLSPLQSGMLFRTLFVTEHAVYLDQHLNGLHGELNVEAFKSAWQMMIDRHTILRTSFHWEGLDDPLQVVHSSARVQIDSRDLSGLPKEEQRSALDALVTEDRARGVNLSKAPLMRLTLIKLDSADWRFIWTIHHLLLDRWSTAQVLSEMLTAYRALCEGRSIDLPPLRPYGDFIEWIQEQSPDHAESYWRRRLAGIENPTILPVDKAPGSGPGPDLPILRQVRLSEEASEALQALARRNRLTFSTLIQGAWALLLSRYTGEEDVLFGATVSGRPASMAGVESMVGMFINSLPIRVRVDNSRPLIDWLTELQENMLELRDYEYSPLSQVQACSDLPRGAPLFESLVIVQNTPGADLGRESSGGSAEAEGLKLRAMGAQSSVDFPLYLNTAPGPRISLSLTYDTSRYDAGDIDRMLDHLKNLVESIAGGDPRRPLRSLSMFGEDELNRLLVERNESKAEYRDVCVHQLFEEQAERTPNRVAVEFAGRTMTYAELNERANQLAAFLRENGAGPDTLVGLGLERSIEMIVGVYGILKAGSAYVPLDPSYPPDRLARMVADARAPIILTQESIKPNLPQTSALIVSLDGDWDRVADHARRTVPLDKSAGPDNLVYVIYTSGSTGVPKGTAVCHRGFSNLVQWFVEEFGYDSSDRSLLLTSISFDLTQKNLYAVLAVGGTLHLAPSGIYDPDAVAAMIADSKITHLNCTPSHFYPLVADENGFGKLSSLRYVYLGGEPIELPRLSPWLQSPQCSARLANTYGPTECSDVSTYHVLSDQQLDDQYTIPIGRPIPNVTHYVLDRNLHPVPDGLPGELCIGGIGVGRGYIGRPDMTAERFLPNPFVSDGTSLDSRLRGNDGPIENRKSKIENRLYRTGDLVRFLPDGNLLYMGRLDHQVKVRGFRIELGEIEAILREHPAVREAVVLAREDTPGDKRLTAYVVSGNGAISPDELKGFLRNRLPDYMVPAAFVPMESLPLSPNGKVDRKALPAPQAAEAETGYVPPRTPVEEGLAEIFGELLRISRVSVRDSFFDLGGHSLLATQTVSRIRGAFNIDLPLRALFESPTIQELAEVVSIELRSDTGQRIPPLFRVPRDAHLPLSFAQERLWFINKLDPNSAVYNVLIPLRLSGPLDAEKLEHALEAVVERHEVLRSNFMEVSGEVIQVISEDCAVPFESIDLSDKVAPDEAAKQECDRQLATPFDLTHDRLIRAALLRLGEQEHILAITLHHIVADGWSNGVLVNDLSAIYRDLCDGSSSRLPDLPVQYGDYAAWQHGWLQGEELERQAAFWKSRLAGATPVLDLPTDRPRSDATGNAGDRVTLELSPEISGKLRAIGRDEQATQFMTLLAVFNVVLHAHSGQDDLVVGTDEAGRNHRALENLIGFFVNHLVLRTDMSGNPKFRELVARVRDVCLEAYAHQDFPFDKLVEIVRPDRRGSHTPLFQVLFVMNIPAQGAAFDRKLSVYGLRQGPGSSKYDIGLFVTDTSAGLLTSWIYRTALFDQATIRAMAEDFEAVASRAATTPDITLSELKALLLARSTERSDRAIRERRQASRPSLRGASARRA